MSVDGGEELGQLFEELPKSLTDNVMRKIGKDALKPVRDMAETFAPIEEGDLRDSIEVSTTLSKRQRRLYRKKGEIAVYAGPTYPKGAHGHLVEFGTGPRTQKKTGRYTGQMPARPFMRPAWDANKEGVLQYMRDNIWGVLKKAVVRLRKQAERGTISKSNRKFFGG